MDILIEALFDLILEGSIEISKSKKVPKIIRYLLIMFIVLFFITVIGLIILMGIGILKDNIIGGIIIILIGLFLLIMSIIRFRKTYLDRKG